MLLATLEPVVLPRLRGRRVARPLALGVLALGVVAFAGYFAVDSVLRPALDLSPTASGLGLAALLVVITACFICAPMVLQWGGFACPKVLDNRPLRWLGERSYSLYLLHLFPIAFLRDDLAGLAEGSGWDMIAVLVCVELALLLPMGMASYRFIERPFLNLKRGRRSGSLRPRTAPVPSAAPAPAER